MSLSWRIEPFESFGPLQMHQRRVNVQKLLADPPYEQTPQTLYNRDAYIALGLLLYYDAQSRLEFINATEPCDPLLDDERLIGRLLPELRANSGKLIAPAEWDIGRRTLHFPTLGMALVVLETEAVSGIILYCEGYHLLSKQWPI